MRLSKAVVAVAAATALLSVFVGGASARRLSISSQTWRTSFARFRWDSGFVRTICPMTLEGSLHSRTIQKVRGALVGYLTSVTRGTCSFNEATVLRETLPWHVQYGSFGGFLPTFSSLTLNVVGFSIRGREVGTGVTCLSNPSTAETPVGLTFAREARGASTEVTVTGEVITGVECIGAIGRYDGSSSSVTALNSASRITLTLI